MKNWSVDVSKFEKNPAGFRLWQTEQLINFGLGKAKLEKAYLKKNFSELAIDPQKKTYLSFLLWGQKSSPKRRKNS